MRGHLFENMIISEALKQMYHAGSSDAFYFFRDHKGNEVDLALPGGAGFHAMAIKSAQTVSPDFFKGLQFFQSLETPVISTALIYGGDRGYTQNGTRIVPWRAFRLGGGAGGWGTGGALKVAGYGLKLASYSFHHPTTPPPHHPIPFSDNPPIIFENSSGMSWKIHRYSTLVKFVIMRKHGYYPTMITAERLIL